MRSLFYNLSWRFKLLLIVALPLVVAIGCAALAGSTLWHQSYSVEAALEKSRERQVRATEALSAILELQRDLYALIAVSGSDAVRQHAIAVIGASSALDESIQRLTEALPDNENVAKLTKRLSEIRPQQMQVIGLARQNNPDQAMQQVAAMAKKASEVVSLGRTILANEQDQLASLAKANSEQVHHVLMVLVGATLTGLLLSAAIAFLFSRLLLRSLSEIRQGMDAFAAGHLQLTMHYPGKDEMGQSVSALAHAVNTTRSIVQKIASESGRLGELASGVREASSMSSQQTEKLQTNTHAMTNQINQVEATADAVETRLLGCHQLVNETSEECDATAGVIETVADQFKALQSRMTELSERVNSLSYAARDITNITQTIRSVADQTNLLALNAAIEAARAGEQGRGFAVVADEVRALAGRSSMAVEEISTLAETIASSVSEAVEVATESAAIVESNVEGLEKAAQASRVASDRSGESRHEIQQLQHDNETQKNAIQGISDLISDLAALSEETSESVQKLDQMAVTLKDSSSGLGNSVGQFALNQSEV